MAQQIIIPTEEVELKPGVVFPMGNTWWRVLDINVEAGTALVIADKEVVWDGKYDERKRSVTWQDCSLRAGLNGTYFYRTFSEEERGAILETELSNLDNSKYMISGGNNTKDRIFLLSVDEAEKYFPNNTDRATGNQWWLRTPGNRSDKAAVVSGKGEVNDIGYCAVNYLRTRPAFNLNLKSDFFRGKILFEEPAVVKMRIPQCIINGSKAVSVSPRAVKIAIPEGVTEIGERCFVDAHQLQTVTMPSTLKSIGRDVFFGCSMLETVTVPEGVTEISESCFENTGLRSVILPKALKKIGNRAFERCKALEDITVPEYVTELGESCFASAGLRSIILPKSIKKIGGWAFSCCENLVSVTVQSDSIAWGKNALNDCKQLNYTPQMRMNTAKLCEEFAEQKNLSGAEAQELAYMYMYQKGAVWKKALSAMTTADNASGILSAMTEHIAAIKKSAEKIGSAAAEFVLGNLQILSEKEIRRFYDMICEKELKEVEEKLCADSDFVEKIKQCSAENTADIVEDTIAKEQKIAEESTRKENERIQNEKDAAAFATAYWARNERTGIIDNAVLQMGKIHYRNSSNLCEADVVRVILNEYWKISMRCYGTSAAGFGLKEGPELKVSEDADRLYGYIEKKQMNTFLRTLIGPEKPEYFIFAYARYISGKTFSTLIKEIEFKVKFGSKKDKKWAGDMLVALLLNDSKEAMQYFEEKKKLAAYARVRDMTEGQMRELHFTPDFGFDKDGIKRYSVRDIRLRIRVLPDTSLELFDEAAGKIVKSVPKKGASEKELEKLKTEVSGLKKEVQKYVKTKIEDLCRIHMSAKTFDFAMWEKIYMGNPISGLLSSKLVWCDEKGNTFIPTETGAVRCDGTPCEMPSRIRMAHVVDMEATDIQAWQNYLLKQKICQPFSQIWEPVVRLEKFKISDRYKGLGMSAQERNALKKTLKTKGVDVYSDILEGEFDYRAGKYDFGDQNTMHIGPVSFDYRIGADKSITIESGKVIEDESTFRILNAVFYELAKMILRHGVEADQAEELTEERLDEFTLAQITEFIALASKCGSANALAVLMDYKNRHYADADPMDVFTLDLL